MTAKLNFVIQQGKTFQHILRWESPTLVYAPISAIAKQAPLSLTATAHGMPDGWRAAIIEAKGMPEFNASIPPKDSELRQAKAVDANTIEFNTLSSKHSPTYTGNGYLVYYAPRALSGSTARMKVKTKVGGTTLLTLTTENGGITLNTTAMTIELLVSATDTAALTWKKGVYDLELVSASGVVEALFAGTVTVAPEITT
jgi:hypothetical protein